MQASINELNYLKTITSNESMFMQSIASCDLSLNLTKKKCFIINMDCL